MTQMRISIKIRADYRPAGRDDQHRRCRHCSRKIAGWKGSGNQATPVLNCKLLGISINQDYTCREYKPEEN
jgi:hypothetical protein